MRNTAILWAILVGGGLACGRVAGQEAPSTYKNVCRSLVIVSGEGGSGSGFVVEMGGKKYILTNQHVLAAKKKVTFTLVEGGVLKPSILELPAEGDLARLLVTNASVPALAIESQNIAVNEPVVVYGNSQGANVMTELKGKIIGVGPKEIEVSAQIVSGNSGSPILNSAGRVVGIITYVRGGDDQSNWISEGTRFQQTRRFGLRIDPGAQWSEVKPDTFAQQANFLADLPVMMLDMLTVVCYYANPPFPPPERIDESAYPCGREFADWISGDLSKFTDDEIQLEMTRRRNTVWKYDLSDNSKKFLNQKWAKLFADFSEWQNTCRDYREFSGAIKTSQEKQKAYQQRFKKVYNATFFDRDYMDAKSRRDGLLRSTCDIPLRTIQETTWVSGFLKKGAEAYQPFFREMKAKVDQIVQKSQRYQNSDY